MSIKKNDKLCSCSHDDHHSHESHETSLSNELACHWPWAAFSIAFGFIILSFINFLSLGIDSAVKASGYNILFHSCHYLHILYAVVGTMVAFARFSTSRPRALIFSIIIPSIFCTLSDIALPTLAGNILGVNMVMHVCFFSELHNIIPLLLVGLCTGYLLVLHHESMLGFFSVGSHFVHILISSLAAIFYMVSNGFEQWYQLMGLLFFFLIIAVVIPCTLSDLVIPWYFSQKKHEKH